MKVGILADIHANFIALTEVLKELLSQKIKQILFLGDLVINGPSPKEVFDTLREIKPIAWIKGNTDDWFNEIDEKWEPCSISDVKLYEMFQFAKIHLTKSDIEFLKHLPFSQSILLNNVKVLCIHGSPRDISESMGPEIPDNEILKMINSVEEDIMLCGHFHAPTNRVIKNKKILNPGSVGLPMDGDTRASYGILEIGDNGMVKFEIKRVNYNLNENLKIAQSRKFPNINDYEKKLKLATNKIDQ
jgi:putative phosphoesterase